MKKTTLTLIMLIASGSFGAVFYLSKVDESSLTDIDSNHTDKAVQVESQKDTEIDLSSTKDAMDYFVSGLAEIDVKTVEENVTNFSEENGSGIIDEALFSKYLDYKSALENIDLPSDMTSLNVESLHAIHQALLDLQEQFFNQTEQALLFEHENRMRELALQKLQLKESDLEESEYQQRLKSELELQPDYVQKSHQNQVLLTQLSQANSLDSQDKYLTRAELVGEEAAQRLDDLDRQRANFSESIDAYMAQRNEILIDETMSQDQQLVMISELRTSTFEPQQLKRVQAIERIQDSSD